LKVKDQNKLQKKIEKLDSKNNKLTKFKNPKSKFMDSYTFQHDVKTFCVTASSFPDGIEEAHTTLHAQLPPNERRSFYGISYNLADGTTIYKAAAEVMEDDGAIELELFIIKNGPYNSFYISDYRKHTDSISQAFELLLQQHEVDPEGYCLEWYINNNDVKCMVPLGINYQPFTGLNREYNE